MVYVPNFPENDDVPNQSAPIFKENFTELNNIFDVNHVRYNDGTAADRGQHRRVTIINTQPLPVLGWPKSEIYTRQFTEPVDGNENQVGYMDLTHDDGTNQYVPLHPWAFGTFTAAGAVVAGYNFTSLRTSAGTYTISFVKEVPNGNYAVICTPRAINSFWINYRIPGPNPTKSFQIVTTNTLDVAADPTGVGAAVSFMVYGTL